MDGSSENASKIELETRLARLNWILRQLQAEEVPTKLRQARLRRRRRYTRSTSQHVWRPRFPFRD
jgi:hypothetical protein